MNLRKIILSVIWLGVAPAGIAHAVTDFDLKLNTSDGTSIFNFQNANGIQIATITSQGDAAFRSITALSSQVSYRTTVDSDTITSTLGSSPLTFSIGANENWSYEFNLYVNGGVGGSKFGINGPAGSTIRAVVVGNTTAATGITSDVLAALNTATTNTYTNNWPTGVVRITGVITNGVTPGTVTLQFLAVTNPNLTIIKANSYVTARRLVN